MSRETCGVEWDDRDDPSLALGEGYSCELDADHEGDEHRSGEFRWHK